MEKGSSPAGISLYGTKDNSLGLSQFDNRIELWQVLKGVSSILATEELPESKNITLFLETHSGQYCRFGFLSKDGQKQQIGSLMNISNLPQWDRPPMIGIHVKNNGTGIFDEVSIINAQTQRLTDNIDPYIGSGGHGHVFVGANVPFGAVQVGPSNFYKGWDWCSGYNYQDSVIIGFPQLHLGGTGIGDLGDILIMPYMGEIKLNKGVETQRYSGYSSKFSHDNEKVRPGYYAVKLDDYGVEVELTASERVGFHKYKFPKGKNARIIIDLKDGINDKS